MSISSEIFWLLLGISFIIIAGFYRGVKVNLRISRTVAEGLEEALKPEDKTYTWLGGVMGFAAEYTVRGFNKIFINFRTIPRHAIIWLPMSLLSGRRDTLQLMFFLKKKPPQEFHIIAPFLFLKPKIFNRNKLKSKHMIINNRKCEILFEKNEKFLDKIKHILPEDLFNRLFHLAITREKNVFFIEIRGNINNKKVFDGISVLAQKLKNFSEELS